MAVPYFFVSPGSLTSPLQAVNSLLSTIAQDPVLTLDPPPTSDVTMALDRLNEVDIEVQGNGGLGWYWNQEPGYTITPDGDGHINLPDLTLGCVLSIPDGKEVVQRGTRLYNRTDHTDVFTAAVKLDLVVRLDWYSLPQQARSYIALLACQRFHAHKQQNQVVLQVNAADVARARAALEQREDSEARHNVNASQSVVAAVHGIGGMRRNRGGL